MFLKGTHSQIVQVFIQYCPKNAYKPSLSRLKQIQQYNSIYLVSLPKSILYNVHIQYCCICSTCGQARFLCGDFLDYFWDSVGVKGNEYVTVSSFTSKYISTILNQCKHMKMKLKNVCIQFFYKNQVGSGSGNIRGFDYKSGSGNIRGFDQIRIGNAQFNKHL